MPKRPKLNLKPPTPTEEPAPATPAKAAKAAKASTPAKSSKTPPSREGSKFIGGHFPRTTWDTFRKLGVEYEMSGQDLLQEAIDDLFAKYRNRKR